MPRKTCQNPSVLESISLEPRIIQLDRNSQNLGKPPRMLRIIRVTIGAFANAYAENKHKHRIPQANRRSNEASKGACTAGRKALAKHQAIFEEEDELYRVRC